MLLYRSFRACIWVAASDPGLTPWAKLKAFSLIPPCFCSLVNLSTRQLVSSLTESQTC